MIGGEGDLSLPDFEEEEDLTTPEVRAALGDLKDDLRSALEAALATSVELAKLEVPVVEEGNSPFRGALRIARDHVEDPIAREGLVLIGKLAPVLEDATRDELRGLFSDTYRGSVDSSHLGRLGFEARRALMRDVTREELAEARVRAERLAVLGDLAEDAGDLLLAVLPLLIAAL